MAVLIPRPLTEADAEIERQIDEIAAQMRARGRYSEAEEERLVDLCLRQDDEAVAEARARALDVIIEAVGRPSGPNVVALALYRDRR